MELNDIDFTSTNLINFNLIFINYINNPINIKYILIR